MACSQVVPGNVLYNFIHIFLNVEFEIVRNSARYQSLNST